MSFLDDLFNKHKLVRRLLVFWCMAVVSLVLFVVYSDLSVVTTSVASITVAVIGLVATAFGFYFTSKGKDK